MTAYERETEILIIGAGITGLSLAKRLEEQGKDYLILEARERLGGRIQTFVTKNGTPVEMGGTWWFPPFSNLRKLLKELEIDLVKQYIDGVAYYEKEPDKPAREINFHTRQPNSMSRIKGGSSTFIRALATCVNKTRIYLSTVVKSIEFPKREGGVLVHATDNRTFRAKQVVTTIPPQLLAASINFSPPLPPDVMEIASETHTWMGDAVKAAVIYEKPFWKTSGKCGGFYSDCGPFLEIYDQSSHDGTKYALVGFLDDRLENYPLNIREDMVISQLEHVLGKEAGNYIEYKDRVWSKEKFTTAASGKKVDIHQNNAHIVYQQSFYDGRLVIAGAETSLTNPGYMEGAVASSIQALHLLSSQPI